MSLALVGDIVLAARSATFVQLFAPKVGLMPDLGSTFFLPRLIGTARAKGMTLLGDALSAPDAERWGLIWACVDDAALLEQAHGTARRLAAGPTQAFKRIKRAFNRQPAATLPEQLALEAVDRRAWAIPGISPRACSPFAASAPRISQANSPKDAFNCVCRPWRAAREPRGRAGWSGAEMRSRSCRSRRRSRRFWRPPLQAPRDGTQVQALGSACRELRERGEQPRPQALRPERGQRVPGARQQRETDHGIVENSIHVSARASR